MNIILFDKAELDAPLPRDDPRARHLREVLKRRPGEPFDCGLIDGPYGKATVVEPDAPDGVHLHFAWTVEPPPPPPLSLLVGLPRPQTARKILREAATLGVATITFFGSDRGESSYAASSLWRGGEVRRHLIEGAAQAFCTRLPEVQRLNSLADAFQEAPVAATKLALDNYEAVSPLSETETVGTPAVLAVGSERGWSGRERDLLREAGYTLAHLGPRVFRTETACIAGIVLLRAKLGLMR